MKRFRKLIVTTAISLSLVAVVSPATAEGEPTPTIEATPTETVQPETVQPEPTESTQPEPTESTQPEPIESTQPEPIESTQPEPTETVEPVSEQLASLRGNVQKVLGPSGHIDSLYVSVRDENGRQQGYMSNLNAVRYRVGKGGVLYDGVTVLKRGPIRSVDRCGLHLAGPFLKITKRHWVAWYHGDQASPLENHECRFGGRQIRGAVYRAETFDGGMTWHKRERVLSQDRRLMSWSPDRSQPKSVYTDDAGSPRFIIRRSEGYIYMIYRAVYYATGKPGMFIARAPINGHGKGGTWRKQYQGEWSQPGLGGYQTPINLPDNKRGLTWNTHLDSYVTAHANAKGIWIYRTQGRNLTHWTLYAQVGNPIDSDGSWGNACRDGLRVSDGQPMPEARGYGVSIGLGGDSQITGQEFWVYWMWKPLGKCFTHRYLVRQRVTLR